MSNSHCPDCGWLMTEHVELSETSRDNPRVIFRCSNPDCDHTEERTELTI